MSQILPFPATYLLYTLQTSWLPIVNQGGWQKLDFRNINLCNSVQAEYEIFATPTFLDPFDLRKLLASHFFPSGIVFTYPQGPLALGS